MFFYYVALFISCAFIGVDLAAGTFLLMGPYLQAHLPTHMLAVLVSPDSNAKYWIAGLFALFYTLLLFRLSQMIIFIAEDRGFFRR